MKTIQYGEPDGPLYEQPTTCESQIIREAEQAYEKLDGAAQNEVQHVVVETIWWTNAMGVVDAINWLCCVAWMIAFIAFVSQNAYNTRLDYNTDYLGRGCPGLDDDDVCQETDLRRVHGDDIHWHFMSIFITLALAYPVVMIIVGFLHAKNWVCAREVYKPKAGQGPGSAGIQPRPLVYTLTWPMRMLGLHNYSGAAFNYNLRHLIFDTLFTPIVFGMLGVRDFTKLMLIGVAFACWNFCILFAERDNRTNPIVAKIEVLSGRRIQANPTWLMPIMQAAMGVFLWVYLLVYYTKFPSDGRRWYTHVVVINMLIFIGLRCLFCLLRWVTRDTRVGSPTVEGRGALSSILRFVAHFARGFSTVFFSYPLVVQLVLAAYDFFLMFLPWLMLAGLDGHDNIARIVFPKSVDLVY